MTPRLRPLLMFVGWCLSFTVSGAQETVGDSGKGIAAGNAGVIAQTLAAAPTKGKDILRAIDARDERQATAVLEYNLSHEMTAWINPDTDALIAMTPTASLDVAPYDRCRAYTLHIEVSGDQATADATACKKGTMWTVLEPD